MKSFDDFMSSISEEDYACLQSDVNELMKAESAVGNKIFVASTAINQRLLHLYHDWLQSSEESAE